MRSGLIYRYHGNYSARCTVSISSGVLSTNGIAVATPSTVQIVAEATNQSKTTKSATLSVPGPPSQSSSSAVCSAGHQ